MDKQQLAQEIKRVSELKGSFTLRSGQKSDFYFDKYRFESNPQLLEAISGFMKELIPKEVDLLGGLELGGVPLATALSLKTGIPCIFVRKEAKTYGTCALAEGGDIANKKIVLIEDVITTGGQVCESAVQLRERGALVKNVVCVIHRSLKPECEKLTKHQLQLKSLFNLNDLR